MTRLPGAGGSPVLLVAWAVGWVGLLALAACGLAHAVPSERLPPGLAARLPVVTMLALATSTLLGWGCVQMGQQRLRRRLGAAPGGLLLAVLPLACAAAGAAAGAGWLTLPTAVALVIQWLPPAVLALALAAFLTWRTRPRTRFRLGRGLWFAALSAPYVVLVAAAAFDLPLPWLRDSRAETLDAIGGGAIAFQLALAYVVGDTQVTG